MLIACVAIVVMAWSLQHAANETDWLNRFAAVLVLELSTDPAAVDRLGTPLSIDGQASGRISGAPEAERLDMMIPVAGSRALGKLHVQAAAQHGDWTVTSLELQTGRERIALDLERVNKVPGTNRGVEVSE